MPQSVVLAYSGGLDTSVLVGWLIDQGYDVHALYVDLGQPCEDRGAILEKALDIGAVSAESVDAREELCRDFAFPVLQWQAKYENIYLLGTSIARPLIAKCCVQRARDVGAVAFVHGATGKGNDQCRFQLAAEALDPTIKIIAPWRLESYRQLFPGRTEMLAYCERKKIPVKATAKKPYSSDENCLHISYEAGKLEDPAVDGIPIIDFGMTVSPQEAPDKETLVTVGFEAGVPVWVREESGVRSQESGKSGQQSAVSSQKSKSPAVAPAGTSHHTAYDIVDTLNRIAGANGVGRIDVVENRFVGMKSRGVYEAPGMTCLYTAHQALEQLTLDRDLVHLRDRISPEVAEMVYYGFWYCAKMDALMSFIREAQQPVTGEVTLGLYKGNCRVVSRKSPFSLYDEAIASMEGGGSYNQTDAEGFLRITGLPHRVQAGVRPRKF